MSFKPEAAIERLKAFNIHSTTYKTIKSHALTLDILIPKSLKSGKHPLIVRFHGGFLIFGSASFPGFFHPWILDLALQRNAIVVSPNYRKLPESNATDILEDLADFWRWVQIDLSATMANATNTAIEAELSRTLVIGHSAGGYLAVQSGIMQPAGSIKAIVAAYPMLDMKSPWFTQSFDKSLFGRPMLPNSVVDDHLAAMKTGEIVSAVNPPKRFDLVLATVQHGRYPEMMGIERRLYPMESLGDVGKFPPLFIYHGIEDSAVPVEGTERFVRRLKEILPKGEVLMRLESGEHGFDTPAGLEVPWLKDGLKFVSGAWLKKKQSFL